MKTVLIILASVSLLIGKLNGATIAHWTFEPPYDPPTVMGNTITGLFPAVGNGLAMGFHASATTVFTAATGNGSPTSLVANEWTPGDYWQFQTSTIGFTDIQLGFAQIAINFGATNFSLRYSLDGSSFTTILSQYTVLPEYTVEPWNPFTPTAGSIMSVNLSAISELNNASSVYFRLENNVDTPWEGSTGYIDDFYVTGTLIPEPSTLLLPGLATLAILARRRPGSPT